MNPRIHSRNPLSEKHIEQTCTQWLELDGWRSLKTDPVSRREWGKGFGEIGMADHLYIRYLDKALIECGPYCAVLKPPAAEILWCEFKRQRGGNGKKALFTRAEKAKIHQKAWIAAERARGALVWLCGEDGPYGFPPTIEGFQQKYRTSGLMRRKI